MRRQSGLNSGSSRASTGHSSVSSMKHASDVKKGGRSQFKTASSISIPSTGVKPSFLIQKGGLRCEEFPHAVKFGKGGKSSYLSDHHFLEWQEQAISDCLKSGIFRPAGRKKKDGTDYLRKCPKKTRFDVMQRRTCVFAPHVSILYKRMSPKTKGQFSKLLAQVIREASEKRWPDAELQGVQLHDDTQYLHMDLWSLKGKMVRHKSRGQKEKDVLLFSAAAIAQKGAGHGAVYLAHKKRIRGEIHAEDEKNYNAHSCAEHL